MSNKKTSQAGIIKSQQPSLKVALVLVGLAALLGIYVIYRSFAATATLSLAPATSTVAQGANVVVTISENSSTDSVNAVEADLTFPKDKLQFVSIDSSTSAFSVQAANAGDNTLGTVTIARGAAGGTSLTGSQEVARVTFKSLATGSAAVAFAGSSAVVRNSDNINVLATKTGGIYTITGAADTTAPSVPTTLTSPSQTMTSVNLSWLASTDNVGVTGYKIFRNGTQVGTSGTTTFSSTGLVANTSYSFMVAAYDAAGNTSAQSAAVTAKTLSDAVAPSAPTGLTAPTKTINSVSLSWTASTDNVGVTGYKIFRNGTQVGTSITTSFTNTGLAPATAYSFTVAAYDAVGNTSAQSAAVSATTLGDTVAPSVPTGLHFTTFTTNSVSLAWTASTDNIGVTGYKIYRNGIQIATATATSFNDTGLTTATPYSFTVAAYDAAGNTSAITAALVVKTGLIGDINKDGKVDVFDLSLLLANYGKTASQASNPGCDIDGNGVVDVFDLSKLLANYTG